MKTIQLNKGTLELPEAWEELTKEQKIFTVDVLRRLFSHEIAPDMARIKMLVHFTGYKHSKKIKDTETREIINFNLIRLAEQLNFAFKVEENVIIPNFSFKCNPLPSLTIDNVEYSGKIFNLDITAKTNITAKEFVDAFDLLVAFRTFENEASKEECLNQLCAIFYPSEPTHTLNLVGKQIENMRKVSILEKTLIFFWFTGIVKLYTEHPVYSVLFSGKKEEPDEDKIRIGANETALYIHKEGYGNPETMNLNDYFDAQVKALKDTINHAIAQGAKETEISQKTGIPINIIHKLS